MEQYFAAKSSTEFVSDCLSRVSGYRTYLQQAGLIDNWASSYDLYYGQHFRTGFSGAGTSLKTGGRQGELMLLQINHFRNLIRHMLIMTTNQRPAFDVRAINTDVKSMQQAKLGGGILDTYMRQKRLGRYLKKGAELGLVLGKGFLKAGWEPSLGRPYTRVPILGPDGQPTGGSRTVFEGDVSVSAHFPHDVYYDPSLDDFSKAQWVLVRSFRNKFDLMARYPDLAERITSLPTKRDLAMRQFFNFGSITDTTEVEVFEFFHLRTEACPNGRYAMFGADNACVMYDGPYQYNDRLPVFRIVPGEVLGTSEGYSEAFDIIPVQQGINLLASAIMTNQNANAVQNIIVPENCNLSVQQLANGNVAFKYNPQAGKPEALQLTNTPKEVFEFLGLLERFAETLSGVNSVARGNPEKSLDSGVALGLVQSMAIQYASGFQESWVEMLEDVGTFILVDCLKPFAKTKRLAQMAGQSQKAYMVSFQGSDLEGVERVTCELGNPMTRTTAGRVAMADTLLNKGLVTTPQEYLTVMDTGQLDPAIQGPQSTLSLIHQENEDLRNGLKVEALVGDKHLLHSQEHMIVANDPQIRRAAANGDPMAKQILQNTLDHVSQHNQLHSTQDPFFSIIAGEPPAPPPPGMGPPPPPGQGGPGPEGGPGGPPPPPGPGEGPPSGPGPVPGMDGLLAPPMQMKPIPRLPQQYQPVGAGVPLGG